jgi:hypothetical protein
LLTLALDPTAFSTLAIYSNFMAPLTIAIMLAGTYFMCKKIGRICRCNLKSLNNTRI